MSRNVTAEPLERQDRKMYLYKEKKETFENMEVSFFSMFFINQRKKTP